MHLLASLRASRVLAVLGISIPTPAAVIRLGIIWPEWRDTMRISSVNAPLSEQRSFVADKVFLLRRMPPP